MMLFGDKKEFAIELEFEKNKKYAHILLYISDIYIGTKLEVTYINSFLASLELRLIDLLQPLPKAFSKLSPAEVAKKLFHDEYFMTLETSEVDNPDYDLLDELRISNLEDTFDAFDMIAYLKNENNMMFCWEVDLVYHTDKNYPAGIHCKELNFTYVKDVITECIDYVNNEQILDKKK